MAQDNFERQEESTSRALDKPREYPLGPASYYPSPEDEIHLRDYLQIVLRRKWIVITFLLTVLTTVSIGTFMMKAQYKATTTIKIEMDKMNILSFNDVYQAQMTSEDSFQQTQFKVLKSRNLARRVIRQMKLDASPEFSGQKQEARQAASFLKKPDTLLKDEGIDSSLVDGFIGRVEVTPQKGSSLVNVSFVSYDPAMAANVVNALAKSYIDLSIESKYEATQQAREWLEKQLEAMKAKVEQAEEKLNQYAGKNEIIFLETKVDDKDGKGGGSENLVTKKLGALATELIAATSERIQKEALYNELKAGDAESSSLVMNSPLMQALRKDAAALESDYNQNLKIYKPDYPKMVKLKELIDQINKRMATEAKKIVNSIRKDYEAAVKKESYLKAAFDRQKQEALELNNRAVQYLILKREADTNKELYNGLLQRLKETGISATLNSSNIQVLDKAEVPKGPFKPNRSRNILLALIVGLFGGVGLAFFTEYLDNTIKTPEDVEKRMFMPSLGIVPLYASGPAIAKTGKGLKKIGVGKPETTAVGRHMPVEYISHLDSKSQLSEAYTSIRTFLLFSSAGKPPKVMMITSARREEGKTTTSINTAISLTKSNARAILIDADMRRPRLHKIFKVSNSNGLSSFLSGNAEFSDDLIKHTDVPNLDVITSGPLPPNPAELLSSYRLRDLLDGLYPLYNFIVIDTPPLLGLADAAIASTQTDGVILVVKSGSTPKDAAVQAKKILESVNAKVLGVVLNAIDENNLKYGYYSYYQYYYQNYTSDEK
ncbi:MAG: polysaccharide biosynthesis tyrosine autokinase [Nitrospirae bacterium]|nr:polysaccharide biosynthesis tyrosine autokinase [Nitrospirota bacterium]